MRLWRFEFGKWKPFKDCWKKGLKTPFIEFERISCNCLMLTVGRFYFTYLSEECRNNDLS